MKISLIVAMSCNRVIGKNGQLPWKISEDLKRFRTLTSHHSVIMGRKTFESIGKILPQRENIIISRQKDYKVPGAKVFASLDLALEHVNASGESPIAEEVFVIGGGEIYQSAISKMDRLYLTLIHSEIEGDAFFPEFDSKQYVEISREDRKEPLDFSFILLERKK